MYPALSSFVDMLPYSHILVSTDFSSQALEAVRTAARFAAALDARITLVHVIEPPPAPVLRSVEAFERELARERADEVTRRLEAIRHTELRDLRVALRTEAYMNAALAICEIAEAERADLCVLGTHGRTGVSRALLGSVAERVVRHAHCDVLAARAVAEGDGARPIVAATDFSSGSEVAIERARSLGRRLGLPLELLHVHDETVPVPAEEGRGFVSTAVMKERLERHLAATRDAYFGDDTEVGCSVIASRSAADAIARFAADYRAWLVVVGTHGRTGATRFLIGSVAERSVRLAPCSVLVARPR
jgi:nucleotide-binding universal stress UspA family protein